MQLTNCCGRVGRNLRDELWSYCALAGILLFNTSIVLLVYAYKRATQFPVLMEIFGITLLVLGVLSILASWYFHRQHRQKKRPCFCMPCCCRCCRGRGSSAVDAAENSSSASSMRKATCVRGNGRLFGEKSKESRPEDRGAGKGGGADRPFSTPEFRVTNHLSCFM
ncbi:hypothetical protein ElyMa_006185500 [Elysia marginata]|uniref:Uncharacterized protein n=1 Tax=Elysia marginata TaxID=1093978 RepID=A0AAV4H1T7_9GAST|nr:hypothetical protein ElyMa_006185500 [Elysia marginata]